MTRVRSALFGLGAACAALVFYGSVALLVAAARQPLPLELRAPSAASSLRVYDRNGRLERELRGAEAQSRTPVRLDELSPYVVPVLLAAEDARFFSHPGADAPAIARAALDALLARRVVSGASTLTQQLARTLVPRPRSVRGKFRELALALRIEAELDKRAILEEYLNRVPFGRHLFGIEAASRYYFDKPAKALDLAESAALVAMLSAPSAYDPVRYPERLLRRRAVVLERARERGAASNAEIERAQGSGLRVQLPAVEGAALHLAFALAQGKLVPELGEQRLRAVHTTLDSELQREIEAIARRAARSLIGADASALAVLVVDNAASAVRAYVGSPDYFAARALGGNDGARALRQPGSTLKPFVYAAAMERLGWTPATLLPDLALSLPTPNGRYVPKNYDGKEHGPVRLRVALGSSLNLPALYAAQQVGPSAVLELLRRFGFASLDRQAEHYGVAIALGDGEVRLDELASAYAALARDGEWRRLEYVERAELIDGRTLVLARPPGRRVVSQSLARTLTDVLSDDGARSPTFGAGGVLSFPFPVAAKTGTSKGFRDNWAVAYTREVTVAVWVGNFDGRPMLHSSGVTGAGPVLHETVLAAMRGRRPAPLLEGEGFVEREVCALSGALPTAACPERVRERFSDGRAPSARCAYHEQVGVDPASGLRSAPGCAAELATFERYPEHFLPWARAAGRPLAPFASAADCSISRAPARADGALPRTARSR